MKEIVYEEYSYNLSMLENDINSHCAFTADSSMQATSRRTSKHLEESISEQLIAAYHPHPFITRLMGVLIKK